MVLKIIISSRNIMDLVYFFHIIISSRNIMGIVYHFFSHRAHLQFHTNILIFDLWICITSMPHLCWTPTYDIHVSSPVQHLYFSNYFLIDCFHPSYVSNYFFVRLFLLVKYPLIWLLCFSLIPLLFRRKNGSMGASMNSYWNR